MEPTQGWPDLGPVLISFGGLPGTGKSTLARGLALVTGATYLRIDTVEQALRDLCDLTVEGEGYELSYRLAADNLRLGHSVVADSCNPIGLTRASWRRVAEETRSYFVAVQVVCSDAAEHRQRVESRRADVPGLKLPTWAQVMARDDEPWQEMTLRLDTAGRTPEQSLTELMQRLQATLADLD